MGPNSYLLFAMADKIKGLTSKSKKNRHSWISNIEINMDVRALADKCSFSKIRIADISANKVRYLRNLYWKRRRETKTDKAIENGNLHLSTRRWSVKTGFKNDKKKIYPFKDRCFQKKQASRWIARIDL